MRTSTLLSRVLIRFALVLTVVMPADAAPRSMAGMELSEALLALKARGLPVVFTSELVRPGMRIAGEPVAREPRQQLDEILTPFGLHAQEAAGGILVVVSLGSTAPTDCCTVTGRVRNRDSLAALAGAVVRAGANGPVAVTDELGRFSVSSIPAGRHSFVAASRGFLSETVEGVGVSAGVARHLELLLSPAPFLEEKIEVFASPAPPSREPLATTWTLGHEELDHMPQLGDPLRGLSLAPGTASGDLTAKISVRGGRPDETKIVLDGQEIYDPYHLKDYESALTIIPSLGLANANLLSGGLSAAHGDRMGGVVDLRTRGSTDPTARLSISTLDALAQSSGAFASERGSWLLSARRGLIDIASEVSGDEQPSFWDLFGRLDLRPNERNSLRAHALAAGDDVHYAVLDEGEAESLFTNYTSDYAWLTHSLAFGRDSLVETTASWSRTARDRNGGEIEDEKTFIVSDERDLDVLGAAQSLLWQATPRHFVRTGWEIRQFDADFEYENEIEPDLVIIAPFAPPRSLTTEFTDELHGDHVAGWISDRVNFGTVSTEVGIRFDDHSLPEESFWSPRAGLAWQIAPRGALLANWGVFRQSQRPYELQVEDGETELAPVERSEQWSVGYEHSFDIGRSPIQSLHFEIFRRDIDNPRPRYESLLEPVNRFHEVEPDRVLVAPHSSRAEGIELLLKGTIGSRVGWHLGYTYSESTDTIGNEIVPRSLDQPNAATLTADYAFRGNWTMNLVWVYHTGWPTTPVESHVVDDPDGGEEIELRFGDLNSERLPDYHRMDIRLSRDWQLRSGQLRAFVEVRNVYNRENVAGYDVSVDEESGEVELIPEHWPGIVPVVGIIWEICGRDCGVR